MRKLFFVLGILIFLGQSLHAQVKTISGKITTLENSPVPGASVVVMGAGKGAASAADANGVFSLSVPTNRTFRLEISAVGYETQVIASTAIQESSLNISLKEVAKGLNEVVVVGYGTAKKKDLTGSVASVPLANNDKTPVFGTGQMLEGTVSGVQVTQTNAQPGASFTVRIRGTNSISSSSDPLYVVDGYAGADINTITPTDIASIDVLKDASATAIYGSRGANGVVIITTKKGLTGRTAVNFDMYTGVQQVARKLNMMDAKQFATYLNQVTKALTPNNALPFTQPQIDALGKGTDWQDALFRTAPISNFNVNLGGGSSDTKYFLSANYFTQDGIMINSGYKRGTIRFNLDSRISDKVHAGFNSQLSYSQQQLANVNTTGGSTGGTLLDALRISPTVPIYDSTGQYTFQNIPAGTTLGNPVAAANLNSDKMGTTRLFANAFIEYEFIKGLKLRSSIGGQLYNAREDVFRPTTTYLGKSTSGYAAVNTNNNYDWLNENTLAYDKQFGIHALNVVAGWTYQEFKTRSANGVAQTLYTNGLGTDNLSVGAGLNTTSKTEKNVLASGLARINYRLMDKYLFTVSMRADGSSRFGNNNKWGYFPSGAFAWRMSDEKYIRKIQAISDLKLRLSYGKTGNQEIGSYNSLAQYGSNTYYLNGLRVVGFSPNNIPNPDLSWESTGAFDGGIDLGLWQNRVTFSGDYYNKKTTNLLYAVSLPSTSGFNSVLENIGSVRNQGFEFSITTVNINSSKLHWSTSLNFSRNINKVLDLGAVDYQFTGNVSSSVYPGGQNAAILKVGQPIGSFYGYKFQGIWQSQDQILKSGTKQAVKPGDPMYLDANHDSILNANDKQIIGHALPKFTYGFSSNLTYGRFNLFVLVQGVYGSNILNENKIESENGTTSDNKFAYVATRSWTPGSGINNLPTVSSTYRRGLGVTSDLIESGSYCRIKTITLTYDLPLPKLTKVFKSASIYITGQNLITFTHYSGYDPEVNSYSNSSGNYTSLNTDYNPYPNIRTYLAGLKFGF